METEPTPTLEDTTPRVNVNDITLSIINNNDKRDEDYEEATSVSKILLSPRLLYLSYFCRRTKKILVRDVS